MPVLAIVGQQARAALGGHYQQEVDLPSPVQGCGRRVRAAGQHAAQVRHLIDRAVRIAHRRRTVTAIILPNDLQEAPLSKTPPHKHGTVHSGIGYTASAIRSRTKPTCAARPRC